MLKNSEAEFCFLILGTFSMIGLRTVGVRVFQISHDNFESTHTKGFHRLPEIVKDIFLCIRNSSYLTETTEFVGLKTCKGVGF